MWTKTLCYTLTISIIYDPLPPTPHQRLGQRCPVRHDGGGFRPGVAFVAGIPCGIWRVLRGMRVFVLCLADDLFLFVTLGFKMIIFVILYNWVDLTNGPYGIAGIPRPELFGWTVRTPLAYLGLVVVMNLLLLPLLFRLYASPFGMTLKALRECHCPLRHWPPVSGRAGVRRPERVGQCSDCPLAGILDLARLVCRPPPPGRVMASAGRGALLAGVRGAGGPTSAVGAGAVFRPAKAVESGASVCPLTGRAGFLSGGERQALAISMVLMRPADLLLLDEPTAGLSPKAAGAILAAIHAVHTETRIPFIIVEHQLKLVCQWVSRGIFMNQGRIVAEEQEPAKLLDHDRLQAFYFR